MATASKKPIASATLKTPAGFDLTRAICSYGYFLLAPSHWAPADRVFTRPLHTRAGRIVVCTLTQKDSAAPVRVRFDSPVETADRDHLLTLLGRIVRLDEPESVFVDFHAKHPAAKKAGFARMFRSPTAFEDIIKTMTSCNVTWPNTMNMNRMMCLHVGGGAFPTPAQLASVSPGSLQAKCRVGYRADRIIRLARDVVEGKRDLTKLEDRSRSTQDVYDDLLSIHGIGPYAAGNLCQLLGRYDRLAIDTETYRHFRVVHGAKQHKTATDLKRLHARIEKHYAKYAPYQFLAYWFELWQFYEGLKGPAEKWRVEHEGASFTAALMK
jgi:3-methyladenine DNA glycosylase/8-oxoguanine DNA glycosylase